MLILKIKLLLVMLVSDKGTYFCPHFSDSDPAAGILVHVLGPRPSMWEMNLKILASGFYLVHS